MITTNVVQRTFCIRDSVNNESRGTAFSLNRHGTEFLITSAQVMRNCLSNDSKQEYLSIWFNKFWHKVKCEFVHSSFTDTLGGDFAIFELKSQLAPPALELPSSKTGLLFGQDVYFAGFPNGSITDPNQFQSINGFPVPFVKKGTFSGISTFTGTIYIEGQISEGFAGSPVAFKNSQGIFQVIGIVDGCSKNIANVKQEGLVACTPIERVNEAIAAWKEKYSIPIGPPELGNARIA